MCPHLKSIQQLVTMVHTTLPMAAPNSPSDAKDALNADAQEAGSLLELESSRISDSLTSRRWYEESQDDSPAELGQTPRPRFDIEASGARS